MPRICGRKTFLRFSGSTRDSHPFVSRLAFPLSSILISSTCLSSPYSPFPAGHSSSLFTSSVYLVPCPSLRHKFSSARVHFGCHAGSLPFFLLNSSFSLPLALALRFLPVSQDVNCHPSPFFLRLKQNEPFPFFFFSFFFFFFFSAHLRHRPTFNRVRWRPEFSGRFSPACFYL